MISYGDLIRGKEGHALKIFLTLLLLLINTASFAELPKELPPVVLQTYLHPPYQVQSEDGLAGIIPRTMKCIARDLNRPFSIKLQPRNRNRQLVKLNKIDGFFLSIPDKSLDQYAVPTEPLALERWNFFYLGDKGLPSPSKPYVVGAVLGSNEEIWLKEKGYSSIAVPNIVSLIKLLIRGRIDYVLIDEGTFNKTAQENDLPITNINSDFVRYVPLIAYFSQKFSQQNPEFVGAFNKSLDKCAPNKGKLNAQEKDQLMIKTVGFYNRYKTMLTGFYSKPDRSKLSLEQKHEEDRKWIKAVEAKDKTPLMQDVLANPVSQLLKDIASQSKDITEIFLTDADGFIIGMNVETSDYWQGDEAAYDAIINKKGDFFISYIRFDHSTRKYQIQVSIPIGHQNRENDLGVLTVGFDAELTFYRPGLLNPL